MDITILDFNDCNLDISCDFENLESEIQNERDNEEEYRSMSEVLEQYKEKSKLSLEETEVIKIGTKSELRETKINVHLHRRQKKGNGRVVKRPIKHWTLVVYRAQMNGAVEASNKNLKKIIPHRDWRRILPFALMAYGTAIRFSAGTTPYSLIHGMESVLPAEFEISFLQIIEETRLEEGEWRRERLSFISEKGLDAFCHG